MVVLGQEACDQVAGNGGSYGLRIGGLFAIMFGSAILAFAPLVLRGRFATGFRIAACFATGIILATAFVHMIPDAAAAMTSPCLGFSLTYPWAEAIAGFVIILSLVIENSLKGQMLKKFGIEGLDDLTEVGKSANSNASADYMEGGQLDADEKAIEVKVKEQQLAEIKQAEKVITAVFLEGGIVFHSIFVGINFGVLENDGTTTALLIALIFHQGFDGLALGTSFVKAKFSNARYITFACIFVLVTPIGIALGIGISQSYQPGSKAALGTEAAFNSISAGLLVYNAIVNLMLQQFPPVSISSEPIMQISQYSALMLGYIAMCIVAKWA